MPSVPRFRSLIPQLSRSEEADNLGLRAKFHAGKRIFIARSRSPLSPTKYSNPVGTSNDLHAESGSSKATYIALAVDPRNEARSDLARLKSRSSSTWKRTRRINLSAISADFVTWSARREIDSLSDFKVQVRGYGSESRRPLLFHSKFHSRLGIPTPRAKVRRDPLAGSDCSS